MFKETDIRRDEAYYTHKITEFTIDLADIILSPFVNKKEIADHYEKIIDLRDKAFEGPDIRTETIRYELCARCDALVLLIGRILKKINQIQQAQELTEKQTKKIKELDEKAKESYR